MFCHESSAKPRPIGFIDWRQLYQALVLRTSPRGNCQSETSCNNLTQPSQVGLVASHTACKAYLLPCRSRAVSSRLVSSRKREGGEEGRLQSDSGQLSPSVCESAVRVRSSANLSAVFHGFTVPCQSVPMSAISGPFRAAHGDRNLHESHLGRILGQPFQKLF